MEASAWTRMCGQLQQATKQRMNGLDQMQEYAKDNPVTREQLSALLDMSGQLLGDNNYKARATGPACAAGRARAVALKTLQVWEAVVQNEGDTIKPFVINLLPFVVERLSDHRQEVRQAACNLMLEVLQAQVLRPDAMMERLSRFWAHKHWKVRHGLLQFVAEAVVMLGESALASRDSQDPKAVVGHVLRLVEDSESAVRDAAVECLEEVYRVVGEPLIDVVSQHGLRPAQLREIYARLGQASRAAELPVSAASGGGADATAPRDTASSRADGAAAAQAKPAGASRVAADSEGESCPASPGSDAQPAAPPAPAPAAAAPPARPRSAAPGARGAPAAPAAAPAAPRRGGFMDAGGVGVAGELPPAPTLAVANERELRQEMEKVSGSLVGVAAEEWQRRVAAMVRLEGIVKGGAAAFEHAFDEALRPLRDTMAEQLLDRRSAVSRQAAHVLEVLSRAMGPRFDAFAAAMLPLLFKVLVITVQVVAEAADACARELVRNHHTPKVQLSVCDAIVGDKSAKLRQSCSVYLLEIVQGWDPHEYAQHEDRLEAAISKAMQDNLSATRAAARSAFAAYREAAPERAAALFRRLDAPFQSKLTSALAADVRAAGAAHAKSAKAAKSAAAAAAAMGTAPARQPVARARDWVREKARQAAAAAAAAQDQEEVMVFVPQRGPAAAARVAAPAPAPAASHHQPQQQPQQQHHHQPPPQPVSPPQQQQQSGAMAPPAARPPAAAASAPLPSVGGSERRSRKSIGPSGLPMRVPGAGQESQSLLEPLTAEPPAVSRHRRASVAPQRVPQPQLYDAGGAYAPDPMAAATPVHGAGGAQRVSDHAAPPPHAAAALLGPAGVSAAAAIAGASLSRASSTSASDDLRLDQLNLGLAGHAHAHPHVLGAGAAHHAHDGRASAGGAAPGGSSLAPARATLARAAAAVLSASKDWRERVERLDGLSEALLAQAEVGFGPAEAAEVEKALPKLMAAMDDGHFKISLAALGAVQSAIRAAPRAVESALDKLMPLLFLKLCAPKEATRGAAEAALQGCALQFNADALLPALNRSLDTMKQPAAKVSVMEFCVLFIGEGKWVSRNLALLLDKNTGVRKMAAKALGALHAIDTPFIASCLAHAAPPEVVAFERALAAGIPGVGSAAASRGPSPGEGARFAAREGAGEEAEEEEAEANGGGHEYGFSAAAAAAAAQALAPAPQQQLPHPAWQDAAGCSGAPAASAAAPAAAPAAPAAAPAVADGGDAGAGMRGSDGGGAPAAGGVGGVQHEILGRTFVEPVTLHHARVELPSDPAGQARHLTVLVHRLQSRAGEDVLGELAACAESAGQEAWDANFSKVLLAALAATKHASERVREAAFALVRQLALHQPGQFGPVLDVVVQPLLLGCADPSREVLMAAHQALEALVDAMPPARSLDILRLKLPSADAVHSGTAVDGDVLCAAIRCVQRAAARAPPAELAALAPGALLPGLFAAFQHPRPDVRKVVVFALVDLWMLVGDGLTPHLSSLSTSQLKLLTIYYNRAQVTRAAPRRQSADERGAEGAGNGGT
ncbi:MAG: clasp N terminal-domain-containing protein [Monoraphidium minutum]|nr:MAG: clasp N terminal-domain-containing protein [Monoraphidium minutum]